MSEERGNQILNIKESKHKLEIEYTKRFEEYRKNCPYFSRVLDRYSGERMVAHFPACSLHSEKKDFRRELKISKETEEEYYYCDSDLCPILIDLKEKRIKGN